jgi:hypothetical protein
VRKAIAKNQKVNANCHFRQGRVLAEDSLNDIPQPHKEATLAHVHNLGERLRAVLFIRAGDDLHLKR